MGTIADKLGKVLETKGELRNAIEAKGVAVDAALPFAQYPSKIAEIDGGTPMGKIVETIPIGTQKIKKNELVYLKRRYSGFSSMTDVEIEGIDKITLPTSTAAALFEFSLKGDYFAVAQQTRVGVWSVGVDETGTYVFTPIPVDIPLPTNASGSIEFTKDGGYLLITTSSAPYIHLYKNHGTQFTKVADSNIQAPTGASNGGVQRPPMLFDNDNYFIWTTDGASFAELYKLDKVNGKITKSSFDNILTSGSVPTSVTCSCYATNNIDTLILSSSGASSLYVFKKSDNSEEGRYSYKTFYGPISGYKYMTLSPNGEFYFSHGSGNSSRVSPVANTSNDFYKSFKPITDGMMLNSTAILYPTFTKDGLGVCYSSSTGIMVKYFTYSPSGGVYGSSVSTTSLGVKSGAIPFADLSNSRIAHGPAGSGLICFAAKVGTTGSKVVCGKVVMYQHSKRYTGTEPFMFDNAIVGIAKNDITENKRVNVEVIDSSDIWG